MRLPYIRSFLVASLLFNLFACSSPQSPNVSDLQKSRAPRDLNALVPSGGEGILNSNNSNNQSVNKTATTNKATAGTTGKATTIPSSTSTQGFKTGVGYNPTTSSNTNKATPTTSNTASNNQPSINNGNTQTASNSNSIQSGNTEQTTPTNTTSSEATVPSQNEQPVTSTPVTEQPIVTNPVQTEQPSQSQPSVPVIENTPAPVQNIVQPVIENTISQLPTPQVSAQIVPTGTVGQVANNITAPTTETVSGILTDSTTTVKKKLF